MWATACRVLHQGGFGNQDVLDLHGGGALDQQVGVAVGRLGPLEVCQGSLGLQQGTRLEDSMFI